MKTLLLFSLVVLALLSSGCSEGDEEIRVYQLTKPAGATEQPPSSPVINAPFAQATPPAATPPSSVNPSSGMTVLPGMAETAASFETPAWTVPASWEELPATPIRKGNFRVSEGGQVAEITVTAFPGDVGGMEANVNRWRGQIGLAAEPLSTLQQSMRPMEIDGEQAFFIDLSNGGSPQGKAILGAIIPRGENTWFVKMIGDSSLLSQQESSLTQFLGSIDF